MIMLPEIMAETRRVLLNRRAQGIIPMNPKVTVNMTTPHQKSHPRNIITMIMMIKDIHLLDVGGIS
jgi:hypothetical protein